MDLSQAAYLKQKFTKLTLNKETLQNQVFDECHFEGCTFIDCKFEKSRFINCEFKDSLLSAVVPMECRFIEVHFNGCKVNAIDWTKTLEIRELSFSQCQVNFSNFRFLKLTALKIVHCQVKDSDFTEADLTRADFKYSDLENTRFFKTNLSAADFKGALNYQIDVTNNVIKKARFSLPEAVALLHNLDIIIE
jgi:fluoroquinolone resistance protein